MKVLLVAIAVLHLALGASIVDVTCPDSCTCETKGENLETSCVSYEFIKKLIPKQVSTIVRLNINNASLVNIDSKLKYLKNLHILDLSNNNIATLPTLFPYLPKLKNLNLSGNSLSTVALSQLPKNLQVVDLSRNSIGNFPKDWPSLQHLKTLHFHDNPIHCDCDNLLIYEQLLKGGIVIPENLTCHYPKEFHGQPVNSVNCSLIKENLLNLMLGDDAGSGAEELDINRESISLEDDQDQLMIAEGITKNSEEELNEEGSGFEGSGFIPIYPIPDSEPKACVFNCSTPGPIGTTDEKDASPPPGIKEEARRLFEDIFQPEQVVTSTTPEAKEEPMIIKETDKSQVETFPTNDTVLGEMERASIDGSSSQSVYIIVGLLIAFVAFLLIYYISKKRNQKRRNSRKRNKSNENGFGEEMKPLGKSAENAKPVEQINSKLPNAETAPLLNGQNGKITEDNNLKAQPVNDESKELEEVELRKPDKPDTLTPQPERVTIKAGELPDSVPKTPLLVHRQINSDGEVVTTAINSN